MKAVIIAAGEGRRLRPITKTRPKCMIKIAGKPILAHVIDELRRAGIKDIVLVVKYKEEMLKGYFGDGREFGVRIEYVRQGRKYGTAAAFAAAKKRVDGEFVGMAGDVITDASAIKRLIMEHEGEMTMALKKVENPSNYGVVKLEGDRVIGFYEKPKKPVSHLVNTSMYVFSPEAVKELERAPKSARGEYEITGAIRRMIRRRGVKGTVIDEYWMDIGMPWQFLDASAHIINRIPVKRKGHVENSVIKGKVIVDEGARIFNSYIEGPAYIGKKSVIGPFVYIRPVTSIGDGCSLSAGTTVKNSILMDNVNAKHLSYIGDSIVGENCNFGAGTQIANYRFDAKTVKMMVAKRRYDTEKKKLGVLIGDDTKMGVLACTMPGRKIGVGCWIGAGVVVDRDIPDGTKVFVKQKLEYVR